jgi:uncharacterized membrane protein
MAHADSLVRSKARLGVPGTFVLLLLAFGLAFAFINPPFAVNDEDVHLARIFELASGRLLTRSDAEGQYHYVPADYPELAREYVDVRQLAEGRVNARKVWLSLGRARSDELVRMKGRAGEYPPLLYAPHVVAMWIVKHFDVGGLAQLYAVRIAALLAYVLLAFRAVTIGTKLAWLFIVCALTPMALTQAASVSGDGLVIGFALVFFALVGEGVASGHALSRAELVELVLSAVALTLCKPVYGVVVLCLPALSFPGAHGRVKRALFPAAVALLALAGYVGWSYQNRNMMGPPDTIYGAREQLATLLDSPLRMFRVALQTLLKNGDELLLQSVFVRTQISRVVRFTGASVALLHLQLACAVAVGSLVRSFPGSDRARRLSAFLLIGCWLATVLSVAGALYLCCTRIGATEMRALQGRYFIPALPALLLGLTLLGRPLWSRWLRAHGGRKIFALVSFNNALCLLCLIGWHYYPASFAWPF